MTVECVTLATSHFFDGNPIAEQHRLRYRSIIERQDWDVPSVGDMEYDQYDTPATTYLVWRDDDGIARGSSRLCRTDRPFMLLEQFTGMVTYQPLPAGEDVLEGSRFCLDKEKAPQERKRIGQELILAYLEYGLASGIRQIVGVMYPPYWRNLFSANGWKPDWLGDIVITGDGKKSRAAALEVSATMLERVRSQTGIYEPVLDVGQVDGIQKRYAYAA